jgi:hypothetical protein
MDGQKGLAKTLVIGAASVALASCGGGGGGGSTMTVTVPAVAAAPVIPAGTFLGSGNSGTVSGGSTDNLNITFAPTNALFTVTAGNNSPNGAQVTLTTDTTTGQTRFLQLSVPVANGTFTDTFDLSTAVTLNPIAAQVNVGGSASGESTIAFDPTLNFAVYGVWATGNTSGSLGGFAVGSLTPAAAITPSLGTATYTGGVLGEAVNNAATSNNLSILSGTFTLNANFGSMSVNGTFNINDATKGVTFANLTMPSTSIGSGAGGPFTGTLSGNLEDGNPATMSDVNGHFFGPTANETAGTFSVSNTNWTAIGAFGGKKQ